MKKWLSLILTLSLLCGMVSLAGAEQPAAYQPGDKMEDFTVTLSDGTETSLYGLLAEKKAVLINLWASWCGPCKNEFPFMEQAYNEMSDQIGIIALTCESTDTDETVLALKEELGLSTLPMGRDTVGLSDRFQVSAIPTSVMVDRFGVICFREEGSITDKNKFIRLFSQFTADDYTESVQLTSIPTAVSTLPYPSADEIAKAFQATDERIVITIPADETAWPFAPSPDGAYLEAANGGERETTALLTAEVTAQQGEALQYDYALSCQAALDSLTVTVDGAMVKYYGGDADWTSDSIPFDAAGTHQIEFRFLYSASSPMDAVFARLRGIRILSAEEVAALEAQAPVKPKVLSGTECKIEPVGATVKPVVITAHVPGEADSSETINLVQDDKLTLRITIGKDVDERLAFVAGGSSSAMLSNLPYDDQGYLFEAPVTGINGGSASPMNYYYVCSSATDLQNAFMNSYTCFASEADVNRYIDMVGEMIASAGYTDYEITWAYEDGSPKETEAAAPAAADTAEYIIAVVDETGAPVVGAMVQICDESTCQVAVTDENGLVKHTAAPYPFEIHLLKVPDGYAPDGETHVLPKEGGTLTIPLQKQ